MAKKKSNQLFTLLSKNNENTQAGLNTSPAQLSSEEIAASFLNVGARLNDENKQKLDMYDKIVLENKNLLDENNRLLSTITQYIEDIDKLRKENTELHSAISQMQLDTNFLNQQMQLLRQKNEENKMQMLRSIKSNQVSYKHNRYPQFENYESWN